MRPAERREAPSSRALDGPTAYVSFFGTKKVAALAFGTDDNGALVASVVKFEVPPTGVAPA